MTAVKTLGKSMTMAELKNKARNLGVNPGGMKKTELIHAIQRAEGYTPCYGTTDGTCSWTECCFRQDCLKIKN